jgi:hypothetical protein
VCDSPFRYRIYRHHSTKLTPKAVNNALSLTRIESAPERVGIAVFETLTLTRVLSKSGGTPC